MSHVPYEWVMSHMNESCPIWMGHVPYEWVMSHMNGSCPIQMSHVPSEWVMSHLLWIATTVWCTHSTNELIWMYELLIRSQLKYFTRTYRNTRTIVNMNIYIHQQCTYIYTYSNSTQCTYICTLTAYVYILTRKSVSSANVQHWEVATTMTC